MHEDPGGGTSGSAPNARSVFRQTFKVPASAIDELGHVNNVVYLRWLLEAAVAHSNALGWDWERYRDLGAGWVVRSHHLEYLRPSFEGEELELLTWVHSIGERSSSRRYQIRREGKEVLRAETVWTLVDFATGRSRPIPPEVLAAFPPESLHVAV